MIKSKTIELLKSFSEEEFKEFGLFVNSPFFNREKVISELYEVLKKYYRAFNGRGFTKEKTFAKIYPAKKFNDGMLRNALSKIHSLGERYLAIKKIEGKNFEYSASLLESLSERKLEKNFLKHEKEYRSKLEDEKTKDGDYFHRMAQLEELRLNQSLNQKSAIVSWTGESLRVIQNNIKIGFLISIFKNACYILNERKKMYAQEHDKILIQKLEDYIVENRKELKKIVYLWYYYNSYKLASTLDEKYFYELREILSENFKELSKTDKRNIYVILTNYCYVKRNSGNEKFTKEHFELLRENIKRGEYLTTGKFMSHIFYMNTVITGLGAGEAEWVVNFMETCKQEMDESNRQNTYDFCYSFYYYTQKDYSKALQRAASIETIDLSYKHQLKSLYLKIYFDMNETEPFYSQVDSYKHFISNSENASEELKETINNYIRFTKRLFDVRNTGKNKDFEISKLKREVMESTNLINKDWILSRINEVSGNS